MRLPFQNFELERDLAVLLTPHDKTSITYRDEWLSAPNGHARLCLAGRQDCRWQRVLPQRRDERDNLGEAGRTEG